LELIIIKLAREGFRHITIAVNYKSDLIQAFIKQIKIKKIKIDFVFEKKVLGTMGPTKLIKDLPDNFLLINGDIITKLNMKNFLNYHVKKKSLLTIATTIRNLKDDYGIMTTKNGKLLNFKEKPTRRINVSMGAYGLNKKILKLIPYNKFFGFDDLVFKMLKQKININTFEYKNFWLDIGRHEDLKKAQKITFK